MQTTEFYGCQIKPLCSDTMLKSKLQISKSEKTSREVQNLGEEQKKEERKSFCIIHILHTYISLIQYAHYIEQMEGLRSFVHSKKKEQNV